MDSIIPQNATPQKQCSKCKQWKPATLEYFTPGRRTSSLLAAECKECRNVRQRQAYALKHPVEIIPDGYKRCSKCGTEYPATTDHFAGDKYSKDGLTSQCSECRNAYLRSIKRPHSQSVSLPNPNTTAYKCCRECKQEKLATLDNFHPDKHGKYGVSYVCKECWKSYTERLAKERAANNQETTRTCTICLRPFPATLEYFFSEGPGLCTRCKECRVEQGRLNYKLNEEDRKASRRIYVANNQDMVRAYSRNWHAQRRNAKGTHTAKDIQDQFQRQKGKCYYCGIKLGTGKRAYHVDHVVPLSRGGSNDISNLVVACHTCNERKQDKLLHEWIEGGRLL